MHCQSGHFDHAAGPARSIILPSIPELAVSDLTSLPPLAAATTSRCLGPSAEASAIERR